MARLSPTQMILSAPMEDDIFWCKVCDSSVKIVNRYIDPSQLMGVKVHYKCHNCDYNEISNIPEHELEILGAPTALVKNLPSWVTVDRPTAIRVCVCGGRDYNDQETVNMCLDSLKQLHKNMIIIHGAARGADTAAGIWADKNGIPVEKFPAQWKTHGNAAGPIRNKQMYDSGIDILVAFPGGTGTAHMTNLCKKNPKIYVWEPYKPLDKNAI